jgi:hypothetical protein
MLRFSSFSAQVRTLGIAAVLGGLAMVSTACAGTGSTPAAIRVPEVGYYHGHGAYRGHDNRHARTDSDADPRGQPFNNFDPGRDWHGHPDGDSRRDPDAPGDGYVAT